jgi:N-acetylmuramoyl-L-alanine amidase
VKRTGLVDDIQESPNFEQRLNGASVDLIILHYTGMVSGPAAVDWLCNPASKVSCHYLVDVDGSIVQMVDESQRAWHAGVSSWFGKSDINSSSIGIEIQNPGHGAGSPPFPAVQMKRVLALCLDIMQRNNLSPHQVVAHSDVAPGRKADPGEAFDWEYLAENGVGQVVAASQIRNHVINDSVGSKDQVRDVQNSLQLLGYGIGLTGESDQKTRDVVQAFQRRYRRNQVDGVVDQVTLDMAKRLLAIAPLKLTT